LQQSKAIERAARQMSKALDKEKELNELKTIMGSIELLNRYS
jgi:hypothetical protein